MIAVVLASAAAIALAIAGYQLDPPAREDKAVLAVRIFLAFLIIGVLVSLAGCSSEPPKWTGYRFIERK